MLDKNFLPITIIGLVFLFLISRGCGPSETTYNADQVGVGVSQRTVAVLNGQNLDLTSQLDPAQVPEIVKNAYLEGASLQKKDKELLTYVIQDVSTKLAAISTIDLNEDDSPDPIMVVPEGDSERMTFSIRIPDPGKVTTYPSTPNEWQNIAENQALEVLAVTVYPRLNNGTLEKFDVEARPNRQLYEGHSYNYHTSFMSGYFTATMINSLFFNPWGGWYGPGFYGRMGYYSPSYYNTNYGGRDVQSVRSTRTTYNKATPSTSSLTTQSGKTVSSSLSSQKSSSIDKYKSSAIQQRSTATAQKATGFGASKPSATTSKPSSSYKPASSSSSSMWGRSSSRSSWGGGGSRGGK